MKDLDHNGVYHRLSRLKTDLAFTIFGVAATAKVRNAEKLTDAARYTWLDEHNCAGRILFPQIELVVTPQSVVRDALYDIALQRMRASMDQLKLNSREVYKSLHVDILGCPFMMTAFEKADAEELSMVVYLNIGARF